MKAVGLLSGGLDSALAVELVKSQGIDVVAVNFRSPFCLCGKGGCGAVSIAKQLGVPIKTISANKQYLKMLRTPEHGYGRHMNPCIDCRILMLKKAWALAKKISASFLFTGEVLNQRPMSQTKKALDIIEQEAGLEGKILRPLSARLLPETIAEQKGWIDRSKLLNLKGRSRKKQIELIEDVGLQDYPCPAGGCLLTYKEFAAKVKDLLGHKVDVEMADIALLKIGRHFRAGQNKIIVGRDEQENERLQKMKASNDYMFEVADCGSPIALLQGPKTKEAISMTAALTLRYADVKHGLVRFGQHNLNESIAAEALKDHEIDELRIN